MEGSRTISFKTHTIILLVGPDGAGKTEFSKYLYSHLMSQAKYLKRGPRVNIISYDDIAYGLIGCSTTLKSSKTFKLAEEQSNEIVFSQIESATKYPINSDFIIVDHTSLTPEFRDMIAQIAEEQHYHLQVVAFSFKDSSEYKDCQPYQPKAVRRALSNEMPSSIFKSIFKLEERHFHDIVVKVEDCYEFDKNVLTGKSEDYLIIGDIHGCYDEFITLLTSQGFIIGEDLKVSHPEGKKVLLVGDLIDKGRDIPKVIELAYANIDIFHMVMGNHESFVYRVLKGLMPGTSISELMKREYFQSIDIFLADDALREKFFKVAESMRMFFVHEEFIVTHAPCYTKYLAKLSAEASKSMRDFKYPKKRDYDSFAEFMYEFDELLSFMKKEARDIHPLHIFGHIVTSEVSRYKNKIAIDTGCATGGLLTGIYVLPHGRIKTVSVPSLTAVEDKQKFYTFF